MSRWLAAVGDQPGVPTHRVGRLPGPARPRRHRRRTAPRCAGRFGSRIRLYTSAPITSPYPPRPTSRDTVASPNTKPLHTALRSNAAARRARSGAPPGMRWAVAAGQEWRWRPPGSPAPRGPGRRRRRRPRRRARPGRRWPGRRPPSAARGSRVLASIQAAVTPAGWPTSSLLTTRRKVRAGAQDTDAGRGRRAARGCHRGPALPPAQNS